MGWIVFCSWDSVLLVPVEVWVVDDALGVTVRHLATRSDHGSTKPLFQHVVVFVQPPDHAESKPILVLSQAAQVFAQHPREHRVAPGYLKMGHHSTLKHTSALHVSMIGGEM